MKKTASLLATLLPVLSLCAIPHLQRNEHGHTQLIVNDEPVLLLGGEVGNSTGEAAYLRPYLDHLKSLNLNTLVVPVYWDLVEPQEDRFDFSTVDQLVAMAHDEDLHLVLLWFGSWKNSMSCYAPGWVKRDPERFPRAVSATGKRQEILSPFSDENLQADASAFAAFMEHLKEIDGERETVAMVQVENEIGMIPSARDHSPAATERYRQPVPQRLLEYLQAHRDELAPELVDAWRSSDFAASGSWQDVFGEGAATEEIFMAWHFARYTEAVAQAGHERYALPMYVNAALIRPGYQPGQYPSAGPLPHLIDIWRAGAPTVDFLAPDIYFPNFVDWTRRYTRSGNPLFIPEARRSDEASVNALYAFGEHGALGFSPFGIESIQGSAAENLSASYDLLRQLTPVLLEHQGAGETAGLLKEHPDNSKPQEVRLGGYVLEATFEDTAPPSLADGVIVQGGVGARGVQKLPSGGLVVHTGPDAFLFAGIGVKVTFHLATDTGEQVGILSCEEGRFVDGEWQHIRWLNGDQTHQGRHLRLEPGRFTIQKIKLYRY
ncbi:MAG: glycoside hydrolase family 35 [Puniceicoccaceae bacterium 5H]|nr:MAG: glycoside hydrolase family 35 [Puniceicoccaceae bacterium 5H]